MEMTDDRPAEHPAQDTRQSGMLMSFGGTPVCAPPLTAGSTKTDVSKNALGTRGDSRLRSRGAVTGDRRKLVFCWLAVLGLLLGGCAAQMPPALRSTPPPAALTVGQARDAPEQYAGSQVRWGGVILAVRNAPETTDLEVLARPLDAVGRPKPHAPAAAPDDGRFIARFTGFLDPAQYPEGDLITVTGTLIGVETRDVGTYPYRYPVVRAGGKHLWPRPEPEPDWPWPPGPWGWDPWYDWGYGPWYRPGLPVAPWYRPWYW